MKKKMLLLFIVLGFVLLCSEPVLAANIASCESTIQGAIIDEKIPKIISTIVTVIKVVIPILLVIMGMLDFAKSMSAGKEEDIKKGQKIFVKRLISGALVFLVFTFVQFVISFVADEEDKDNLATCSQCFLNGDCTYKLDSSGSCPDEETMKLSKNKEHCIKIK